MLLNGFFVPNPMHTIPIISARLRLAFDAEFRVILIYDIELKEFAALPNINKQQHVAVEAIRDPS